MEHFSLIDCGSTFFCSSYSIAYRHKLCKNMDCAEIDSVAMNHATMWCSENCIVTFARLFTSG